MVGPFLSYVPPGAYTRTLTDQTVPTLTGAIRFPVFIGVGQETLEATDELFRGSSSIADNLVSKEDESAQLDGTNRKFTVTNFPIVTGEGLGQVTTNPRDVTVLVEGKPVGVSAVSGSTGEVWLDSIPRSSDTVLCTYYYNRTDTQITDEDLSTQVDGTNTIFKTNYVPIVDGSGGGIITNNVSDIVVKVNGSTVTPTAIAGATGMFTLGTAPSSGSTVTVTYFYNMYQDTGDDLYNKGVVEVVRVGFAPDSTDFIEDVDFVLVEDTIQWGAAAIIESGTHTPGTEYFGEDQISRTLIDNVLYMDPIGVGDANNKEFTLSREPVDGGGRDKVTDDTSMIRVFAGTSAVNAFNAGALTVATLDGSTKKVTLQDAPATGHNVYATYFYNILADDCYTLEVVTAGAQGVGTYSITSRDNGAVNYLKHNASNDNVADPDFATEGITWGAGIDAIPTSFPDLQTIPGFSPIEVITVTFTTSTTYTVTSSLAPSGSAGTGELEKTYLDGVTGIRFCIHQGSTVTYTPGDTLEFETVANHTTAAQPIRSIPGLFTIVTDTDGVGVGDTAEICTYDKSGNEPSIGDFYYVTYKYAKTDFDCKLYTKFQDVEKDMGDLNTTNELTLASYIAFQNGSVAVGLCQVLKEPGENTAAAASYINALTDLERPIQRIYNPNFVVPLTTDDSVRAALSKHVTKMSSIRYRAERVGMFGFSLGTTPSEAQVIAQNTSSLRMWGVYPDGVVIGLIDAEGSEQEYAVDGTYLAAAFAGINTAPQYDVATPMTNKLLVGFKQLTREMDIVEQNLTAVSGLTVIEDLDPNLVVRQSLTTDMTSVLTRTPSVVTISDYVQQVARFNLRRFIGIKFLKPVLGDIENNLANVMKTLVKAEIINDFTGITAEVDENDPTIARVEAFYQPVFPLLWIVLTFNLRTRL